MQCREKQPMASILALLGTLEQAGKLGHFRHSLVCECMDIICGDYKVFFKFSLLITQTLFRISVK